MTIAYPSTSIAVRNPYLERLASLPRPDQVAGKPKVVSLFCGGGGLDLGLSFAGFHSSFASDSVASHCETIGHNFPHTATLPIDVNDLTGDMIREQAGENEFTLLCGGPPCQAFSILGQRNSFDDPRGKLVFEYGRLVNELRPKAFIFENVPGLLTVNGGSDWRNLLAFLTEKTGYTLFSDVLNSADYGIPQIRKRVFIVGFRDGSETFSFPAPTHHDPEQLQTDMVHRMTKEWLPARLALENVDGLPNQRLRIHGERVHNRYLKVPQGGRDKIDRTDRIHPEKPSGTVLVGSKAGGGRPFIHPYEPRHITVREAARLQSFPDWYVFQGSNTWQYRAVGNAVPPVLAMEVGCQVLKAIEEKQDAVFALS